MASFVAGRCSSPPLSSLSSCGFFPGKSVLHLARFALPAPGPGETESEPQSSASTSIPAAPSYLPATSASLSEAFGRRFALGVSASLAVAIGGNLGGITSLVLGLNREFSQGLKLDALYPVSGFKRCIERDFEFLYPATWVGDQRLLYRAAERAEKERLLNLQQSVRGDVRKRSVAEPVVAFGPPGSNGELNVSVIVAPVPPDFRLDKIGGPKEAGELILKRIIASKSPKVSFTLLNAERHYEILKGERVSYYRLEFLVEGQSFLRHNVAVYAAHKGQLLSLNAQTPEALWTSVMNQFQEMANSFKVLS